MQSDRARGSGLDAPSSNRIPINYQRNLDSYSVRKLKTFILVAFVATGMPIDKSRPLDQRRVRVQRLTALDLELFPGVFLYERLFNSVLRVRGSNVLPWNFWLVC